MMEWQKQLKKLYLMNKSNATTVRYFTNKELRFVNMKKSNEEVHRIFEKYDRFLLKMKGQ